jgi:Kef-type K+ transport system membrane component KefB
MLKKMKKSAFNVAVVCVTFLTMVLFSLLAVSFSSIFYILIFGFIALVIFALRLMNEKKSRKAEEGKE